MLARVGRLDPQQLLHLSLSNGSTLCIPYFLISHFTLCSHVFLGNKQYSKRCTTGGIPPQTVWFVHYYFKILHNNFGTRSRNSTQTIISQRDSHCITCMLYNNSIKYNKSRSVRQRHEFCVMTHEVVCGAGEGGREGGHERKRKIIILVDSH